MHTSCASIRTVRSNLAGFDAVAGRDTWYAGAAIVDGKLMGPPLGIRSMAATCDGAVLLANVHVGGIPRSTDAGLTWQPTIDIESDVHQVCAHPSRPDIVIAAAGRACISRVRRDMDDRAADFTPIIAPLSHSGETTFSCPHPPTPLRRKAQSIDARSTATVRCNPWVGACRSGPTAVPIPTASRLEIRQSLSSMDRDAYTCRTTMVPPGHVRPIG
jgi:hypothetical protein